MGCWMGEWPGALCARGTAPTGMRGRIYGTLESSLKARTLPASLHHRISPALPRSSTQMHTYSETSDNF